MLIAILTSLWLGILTSISPCPLATNITAVSFLGKNIETPFKTVISGLFYTFGRIVTYCILGSILVSGMLAIPTVANFTQTYINKLIAPILIIVGLILLDVIKLNFNMKLVNQDKLAKLNTSTQVYSIFLGMLFALSFCPVSAALFFGSLTTLAIECHSRIILPLCYGIGTGLPVIIFAIIIAYSTHKVGKIYNSLVKFEYWFRKTTGIMFILAGIYFVVNYYLL